MYRLCIAVSKKGFPFRMCSCAPSTISARADICVCKRLLRYPVNYTKPTRYSFCYLRLLVPWAPLLLYYFTVRCRGAFQTCASYSHIYIEVRTTYIIVRLFVHTSKVPTKYHFFVFFLFFLFFCFVLLGLHFIDDTSL
jgi:hypothetical protein